ncbi:MAG: DUF2946 domain-containing protein [Burkholderiaceae bacterium]|jgi:hypothetical protein|nr:DUF2946 domain-containing protein [Burkholderiales bacterium]MCZ8339111.1 DUF2946 domain-containing protein [Burkholderiaceae bacterium]
MVRFQPRRSTVWIVLWTILLSTLAPAIAAWSSAGVRDGGFHVELCTQAGMVRVVVGDVDAAGLGEDSTKSAGMLGHCPLCATYACVLPTSIGRAVPPRQDAPGLARPGDGPESGVDRLAWRPAHPRAPPPAA